MAEAERHWDQLGAGKLTLKERLDYHGALSSQYPLHSHRIVFAKAGVRPVAAVIYDPSILIDHKLYWAPASSEEEALYLCGVLNSRLLHSRIEHLQAEGQFGKRDLDKLMVSLDIPKFYAKNHLQADIVEFVRRAAAIAASVPVSDPERFQAARGLVAGTLKESGVLTDIDKAIAALMPQ